MSSRFVCAANRAVHYQPGVRSTGTKIALCSRASAYVCVCVCVRPQLSRVLSYVIVLLCHYSHERSAGSVGQGTCTSS